MQDVGPGFQAGSASGRDPPAPGQLHRSVVDWMTRNSGVSRSHPVWLRTDRWMEGLQAGSVPQAAPARWTLQAPGTLVVFEGSVIHSTPIADLPYVSVPVLQL